MSEKYIISKEMVNNPIFMDGDSLRLFLYLLMNATKYCEEKIIRGNDVILCHGQQSYNLQFLSNNVNLSMQKLRSRISILEKAGFISKQTTNQYFIIEIIDFDQYLVQDEKLTTLVKTFDDKENQNDK